MFETKGVERFSFVGRKSDGERMAVPLQLHPQQQEQRANVILHPQGVTRVRAGPSTPSETNLVKYPKAAAIKTVGFKVLTFKLSKSPFDLHQFLIALRFKNQNPVHPYSEQLIHPLFTAEEISNDLYVINTHMFHSFLWAFFPFTTPFADISAFYKTLMFVVRRPLTCPSGNHSSVMTVNERMMLVHPAFTRIYLAYSVLYHMKTKGVLCCKILKSVSKRFSKYTQIRNIISNILPIFESSERAVYFYRRPRPRRSKKVSGKANSFSFDLQIFLIKHRYESGHIEQPYTETLLHPVFTSDDVSNSLYVINIYMFQSFLMAFSPFSMSFSDLSMFYKTLMALLRKTYSFQGRNLTSRLTVNENMLSIHPVFKLIYLAYSVLYHMASNKSDCYGVLKSLLRQHADHSSIRNLILNLFPIFELPEHRLQFHCKPQPQKKKMFDSSLQYFVKMKQSVEHFETFVKLQTGKEEVDMIDGINIMSFESKEDLMEYEKIEKEEIERRRLCRGGTDRVKVEPDWRKKQNLLRIWRKMRRDEREKQKALQKRERQLAREHVYRPPWADDPSLAHIVQYLPDKSDLHYQGKVRRGVISLDSTDSESGSDSDSGSDSESSSDSEDDPEILREASRSSSYHRFLRHCEERLKSLQEPPDGCQNIFCHERPRDEELTRDSLERELPPDLMRDLLAVFEGIGKPGPDVWDLTYRDEYAPHIERLSSLIEAYVLREPTPPPHTRYDSDPESVDSSDEHEDFAESAVPSLDWSWLDKFCPVVKPEESAPEDVHCDANGKLVKGKLQVLKLVDKSLNKKCKRINTIDSDFIVKLQKNQIKQKYFIIKRNALKPNVSASGAGDSQESTPKSSTPNKDKPINRSRKDSRTGSSKDSRPATWREPIRILSPLKNSQNILFDEPPSPSLRASPSSDSFFDSFELEMPNLCETSPKRFLLSCVDRSDCHSACLSLKNKKCHLGMIITVGQGRTFSSFTNENLESLKKGNNVDSRWAHIAASAYQPRRGKRTVRRLVVPVVKEVEGLARRSMAMVDIGEVESTVKTTVRDMVDYVVRREEFEAMEEKFDPDFSPPSDQKGQEIENPKPEGGPQKRRKITSVERELRRLINVSLVTESETREGETTRDSVEADSRGRSCMGGGHCTLGCVCESLRDPPGSPSHCGKEDCIFTCLCSQSSKSDDDSQGRSGLAREESLWHTTVICKKNSEIQVQRDFGKAKREKKIPCRFRNNVLFGKEMKNLDLSPHSLSNIRTFKSTSKSSPKTVTSSSKPTVQKIVSPEEKKNINKEQFKKAVPIKRRQSNETILKRQNSSEKIFKISLDSNLALKYVPDIEETKSNKDNLPSTVREGRKAHPQDITLTSKLNELKAIKERVSSKVELEKCRKEGVESKATKFKTIKERFKTFFKDFHNTQEKIEFNAKELKSIKESFGLEQHSPPRTDQLQSGPQRHVDQPSRAKKRKRKFNSVTPSENDWIERIEDDKVDLLSEDKVAASNEDVNPVSSDDKIIVETNESNRPTSNIRIYPDEEILEQQIEEECDIYPESVQPINSHPLNSAFVWCSAHLQYFCKCSNPLFFTKSNVLSRAKRIYDLDLLQASEILRSLNRNSNANFFYAHLHPRDFHSARTAGVKFDYRRRNSSPHYTQKRDLMISHNILSQSNAFVKVRYSAVCTTSKRRGRCQKEKTESVGRVSPTLAELGLPMTESILRMTNVPPLVSNVRVTDAQPEADSMAERDGKMPAGPSTAADPTEGLKLIPTIHIPSPPRPGTQVTIQDTDESNGPKNGARASGGDQMFKQYRFGLLCLTEGFGYLPVREYRPGKISFKDPLADTIFHSFKDENSANLWLNRFFKSRIFFEDPTKLLKWVIIKMDLLEKIKPFDRTMVLNENFMVLKKDGQLVKRSEFNEQLRLKRKHDFSDDEIPEDRLTGDGPSTSNSSSSSRWEGKEHLSTSVSLSPAKRSRNSPSDLNSSFRTHSTDDDFERPNIKQEMEVERIDLTLDGDDEDVFEDDMEMEELLREDDDLFESDEEIKVMLARDVPAFDSDDD